MDIDEAKGLMKACEDVNAHLNTMSEIIDTIADLPLQKSLRKELGDVVGKVFVGCMLPAIRQFPELDPDEIL